MTIIQQSQYESRILYLIQEVQDFALDQPTGIDYTYSDLQAIVQAIVLGIINDSKS
jgi:hypothetical protein